MNVGPLTYISLFSGVGAIGLGLEIALPDAKCICHVEIEAAAVEVLAARIADGSIADCPIWSDITTFDGRLWRGAVDFLAGGFPCQDLSVAGKRAGLSGKRSGLWGEFERLIKEIEPANVLVENVGGLLSSRTLLHRPDILGHFDRILGAAVTARERWTAQTHLDRLQRRILPLYGISALHYVQACLGAMGYKSEAGLFTAAEVSASHKRERVFVLARRVADRTSGGFRKLRQSPRSDGLADGSDAGLAYASRDERNGPHRQAGPGRGVRETGNGMADAGNGLLPEQGRRPERRDGVGPADTVLADAECCSAQCEHEPGGAGSRRPESSRDLAAVADAHSMGAIGESGIVRSAATEGTGEGAKWQRDGSASGYGGVIVADTQCTEWGEDVEYDGHTGGRIEASGRPGSVGDDLGNADVTGLEGRSVTGSEGRPGGQRVGVSPGTELADADGKDSGWFADTPRLSERSTERTAPGRTGSSLRYDIPLFAPGPGASEQWRRILADHPYLAPAISTEEVECILRRDPSGTAIGVDLADRTDRLRSLGNLAQPLQVAFAIVTLARKLDASQT